MNSTITSPTNPNLIAYSGRMGSGKDLCTKITQYLTCEDEEIREEFLANPEQAMKYYDGIIHLNSPYENNKFSGKLKVIVAELLGVTVSDMENKEFVNQVLCQKWWYYIVDGEKIAYTDKKFTEEDRPNLEEFLVKLTPRKMMQLVGTEAGRDIIHPNIWTNSTFAKYVPNEDGELPKWVISDVRFPNELNVCHENGGVSIRLVRYQLLSSWLKMYYVKLEDMGEYEDLVMSDVEFMEFVNEYDSEMFSEVSEKVNHVSESSLEGYKFHYVVNNNGSIAELVSEIYAILVEVGVIATHNKVMA